MSNKQPYQTPDGQRSRRSDKHKRPIDQGNYEEASYSAKIYPIDDEGKAPLPMSAYERGMGAAKPPRENSGAYERHTFAPHTLRQEPEDDDGYDDYEEDEPRRWPWLLALLVIIVLAISASLFFFVPKDDTGILGKARKPIAALLGEKTKVVPKLIKFETAVPFGMTGVKIVFTLTTDSPVDEVRIQDEDGIELPGTVSCKNEPENTIWTVSVVFEEPFNSPVYASIKKDEIWYSEGKSIDMNIAEPTAEPTQIPEETPMPTPEPLPTPEATLTSQEGGAINARMTATSTPKPFTPPSPAATQLPSDGAEEQSEGGETEGLAEDGQDGEGQEPLNAEATEPAQTASEGTTATQQGAKGETSPVSTPAAAAKEEEPKSSPVPLLTATADDSALPAKLNMVDTVYKAGKKQSKFTRENKINLASPADYLSYDGGVFTFRGDQFRRNAASGTVEVSLKKLSVEWETELGSLRTAESGTVGGLGWTGQPAIVKWSLEVRGMMNLNEEKKNVKALKEVIFSSQDGKVRFLDLNDGQETRSPIEIGYPLKGSVSIDSQGRPLIGFGQGASKLPNKQGEIGYYLYNLIDQSKLYFVNGRKSKKQNQYSTNGAFDGTALFDRSTDTLLLGGENGLLYTVDLNTQFDFQNKKSLTATPSVTSLMSKGKQKNPTVSQEASVAAYNGYVFTADKQGILRCVDTTSMKTVWAKDCGDNTDASPALDFDAEGNLALFTGNTVFVRNRKSKEATIRRLDAMSGLEQWSYKIACSFDKDERSGCKASPVIGEKSISDLVFFTVNLVEGGGSAVIALDKMTGKEVWKVTLAAEAISSPVAVYNKNGDAWIIQGDQKGRLSMIDARSGEVLTTLELGGKIEGSPAVYNDMLVIGTSGDKAKIYGIRIE